MIPSRHRMRLVLQTTNRSLGFFTSPFTTSIFLYHLSATYPVILSISNPRPFFLLTNSALGKTSTSSSQQSYVAFVALGEVVIRSFGGVFVSQSKEYDAKRSDPTSAKVSGATNAPSVSTVFEPLEPSIGREAESSKDYFVSSRIGGQCGRVKLPSAVKALVTWGVPGQPFLK